MTFPLDNGRPIVRGNIIGWQECAACAKFMNYKGGNLRINLTQKERKLFEKNDLAWIAHAMKEHELQDYSPLTPIIQPHYY